MPLEVMKILIEITSYLTVFAESAIVTFLVLVACFLSVFYFKSDAFQY